MEEMLELQDRAARLEKELSDAQTELEEYKNKVLDLTEKISALTNEGAQNTSDARHFRSMASVLETDKKNLERERDRLLRENEAMNNQVKQLTEMVETINTTLQTKEENLLSKEQQVQKKDELLTEKDQKIEEYRQQFTQLAEEKEQYQKEKFDFMEKLNNEKMEMMEKVNNLEKTVQADEQKLAKLKEKAKNAEDGLLGSSMEIEKLQETIAKLNQKISEGDHKEVDENAEEGAVSSKGSSEKKKIAELEFRLEEATKKLEEYKNSDQTQQLATPGEDEDVFGKGTGTYKSISALITHFKYKIGNTQRLLRIIIPSLTELKNNNLMESFDGLSTQILKNIAFDTEIDPDQELIDQLKGKGYKLTDYKGGNVFALIIDNNDAALAVFDKENNTITGVYSNNEELTKLLSLAIMNAFIKGTKLN
jgi:chromosome segregation ATPase